jgi:L-lactate utilization protein LutB
MAHPTENYWRQRLEACRQQLESNNFEAFVAETPAAARRLFLEKILSELSVNSASWGDSMTLAATGILEALRQTPGVELIETFDPTVSREKLMERRRRALLVDLFLTGSNAVTEAGRLVNLDMVGNRVGGITFGPRHVVIVAGRNKIVADLEAAVQRIKDYAAPANAIRHEGWKTPCRNTGRCMDCSSPQRICNSWTITEKSFPKHRIKVILINADLGL